MTPNLLPKPPFPFPLREPTQPPTQKRKKYRQNGSHSSTRIFQFSDIVPSSIRMTVHLQSRHWSTYISYSKQICVIFCWSAVTTNSAEFVCFFVKRLRWVSTLWKIPMYWKWSSTWRAVPPGWTRWSVGLLPIRQYKWPQTPPVFGSVPNFKERPPSKCPGVIFSVRHFSFSFEDYNRHCCQMVNKTSVFI